MATTARADARELIGRAGELASALGARAAACEAARCCPPESVADFKAAGLHRLLQPARYGGHALEWDTHCAVAGALARGCASQGWVLSIYNDHHQALGMFDRRVQDEVWGDDPDCLTSAVFGPAGEARRSDGGYVIAGRWAFASGIDHATWLIAGCRVVDPGDGPAAIYTVLPRTDATVIDDWHVLGLAGTGSKSFAVDGAFVPDWRTLSLADADAGIARGGNDVAPLYRMPRKATGGLGLAAVGVGAAAGMLDAFVAHTRARMARGAPAGDQWAQLRIAEAASAIKAAEALLLGASREMQETARAGGQVSAAQRIASKRDMGFAARLAREAAESLFAVAGGQSLYLDDPLQRWYRDAVAATAHLALRWELAGTPFGRTALGLDPVPGTF